MRKNKEIQRDESYKVGRLYSIGILIVFALFFLRFGQLMILKSVNGQNLQSLVEQLYTRKEVVTASRGNIYDVAGEVIATDVKTYAIYAVLSDRSNGIVPIKDKLDSAKKLAKHLNMKEDDILSLLNQQNLYQTNFGTVGANLSFEQKEAIEQEAIPGIYFNEKITRDYPKGYFSNNIIGFAQDTREDKNEISLENPLKGTMGLELQYNAQLTGIDGLMTYERDFYGLPIQGSENIIEEVKNGNNIFTTLDSRLNDYLEQLMDRTYNAFKPTQLNVMVVRPKSGDVVAASQRPTFNPRTGVFPQNGWENQMVEHSFEPGSTLKVFALAAAVNEGVFSPMDLYRSGNVKVGNITFQDWNVDGWGTITYLDGLARSSNAAFINIVSQIGYDKWLQYLNAFGFGQSTKSGFANESSGLNNFSTEEVKATTSFGQGISVTTLQMMQAFTAIANGGKMQKLRFVDRIQTADTNRVTYQPIETIGQPILSETAKKVLEYLETPVYREGGTAVRYQIDGVRMAIKTGTAQIYDDIQKKYLYGDHNEYIYSLVSFLPSPDPEFIVFMTVRHENALPLQDLYKDFAKFALTYMNQYQATNSQADSTTSAAVSTVTEIAQTQTVKIPDAKQASVETVKQAFQTSGFNALYFFGEGDTVIKQVPVDNQHYLTNTKMMFYTGGAIQMPDFTGWSRQEIMRFANLFDLQIGAEGDGFVVSQNIRPGTQIEPSHIALNVKLAKRQSAPLTSTTITTTTTETTTNER